METYLQVEEILQWLEEVHRRLAGLYDACRMRTDNERARLLLSHSTRTELDLAEALLRFRTGASGGVRRTFFQYVPGKKETAAYLDHLEKISDMTGGQAVDLIHECSQRVEMTYDTLSGMAKDNTVKELFYKMARQVAGQRDATIENYNQLSDM